MTGTGVDAAASTPVAVPVGRTQLLDVDEVGGRVERTVLPGGLRVLTETMPGVLSATLGIWVGVGSRDEDDRLAGSSHFLEHLLFKGTATRSALEIATAMDAVGGEMNAFTAKEHTCYYANVLASDLPLAITLLTDLVTEACNTADLESERTVVLEEIAMRDDEPSDAVHDLFAETLYGGTALGRSVLGSVESIENSLPRRRRRLVPRPVPARPSWSRRPAASTPQQVLDLVTAAFRDRLSGDVPPAPLRAGEDARFDRPARPPG